MPQHFSCTACGRCCHGLRLVLSADEAIVWAERGGVVQILCHAAPDNGDMSPTADYKRQRRFAARSGDLTIQVQVILVARFEGACPNLQPDMRCGIYDERPNVCRIYPAEVMPGLTVDPTNRHCPPEAWHEGKPLFLSDDGRVLDDVTNDAITEARAAGLLDLQARRSLVAALNIDVTALENDGFAVWTIDPAELIVALRDVIAAGSNGGPENVVHEWRIMSPRAQTAELIYSCGASLMRGSLPNNLEFLPLY